MDHFYRNSDFLPLKKKNREPSWRLAFKKLTLPASFFFNKKKDKVLGRENKNIYNFKYNRFNPSVNEWSNSVYKYETGWDKRNSNLINDKLSYNLLNSYFNIQFLGLKKSEIFNKAGPQATKKNVLLKKKLGYGIDWKSYLSLNRIFVSIPEFKHNLQNLNIFIYIFNKEEIVLKRKIKALSSKPMQPLKGWHGLLINNKSINKSINNNVIINSVINKTHDDVIKYPSLNKYGAPGHLNIKFIYLRKKLTIRYKTFLYKLYLARLYFNKFKFNLNSLYFVKSILYRIYNININLNIVKLKYLHLDNSIYVDAITRKLKDRNKKALRVLRNALILPKIPTIFNRLLVNKHIFKTLMSALPPFRNPNFFYKKNTKWSDSIKKISSSLFSFTYKNIIVNKYLTYNLNNNRHSVFYNIKNTHIIGVRLEGSGRLTRRLTASRAVHKVTYLGCLKNVFSSYNGLSSKLNRGFEKSNLNYIFMNSNNRNGAFGIKSWHNTL